MSTNTFADLSQEQLQLKVNSVILTFANTDSRDTVAAKLKHIQTTREVNNNPLVIKYQFDNTYRLKLIQDCIGNSIDLVLNLSYPHKSSVPTKVPQQSSTYDAELIQKLALGEKLISLLTNQKYATAYSKEPEFYNNLRDQIEKEREEQKENVITKSAMPLSSLSSSGIIRGRRDNIQVIPKKALKERSESQGVKDSLDAAIHYLKSHSHQNLCNKKHLEIKKTILERTDEVIRAMKYGSKELDDFMSRVADLRDNWEQLRK